MARFLKMVYGNLTARGVPVLPARQTTVAKTPEITRFQIDSWVVFFAITAIGRLPVSVV
jgi:hypothetical protein